MHIQCGPVDGLGRRLNTDQLVSKAVWLGFKRSGATWQSAHLMDLRFSVGPAASPLLGSTASIWPPSSAAAYGRQRQLSSLQALSQWGSDSVGVDVHGGGGAAVPERVEWDIQDNGMKELAIIQKETERLQALFNQRNQKGPPGVDVGSSAMGAVEVP